MTGWRRLARPLRALAIGLACAAGAAQAAGPAPQPVGSLIVKFRAEADAASVHARAATAAQSAATVRRAQRLSARLQRIELDRTLPDVQLQALMKQLREQPEVEWVVPNERERRLSVPQDPLFPATVSSTGQWWLFTAGGANAQDIELRRRGIAGFQSAWLSQTGRPSVVVAVLDTGITAHPDLDAHILPGRDFVSDLAIANDGDGWDADPSDPGDWVTAADLAAHPTDFAGCEVDDSSWHGTSIAAMLAAVTNNDKGVAGMSWDGRIVPVRVAGKCGAEVSDIIAGMRWAAGLPVFDAQGRALPVNPNPARIINVSFGGDAACNAAYQETIDEIRAQKGAVIVAAAGNDHAAVSRPANCNGVVGVAALNRDGFKASYSNFGASIGIATAGGDPRLIGRWGPDVGDDGLLTLGNEGLQGPAGAIATRVAGTSFSAPIVSGTLALMLSVNPALTADQLVSGLKASARPHVLVPKMPTCSDANPGRCVCTTATCGAGIVDTAQAIAYAQNPTGYVPPARQPEVVDNADVDAAVALGADVDPNVTPPPAAGGSGGGGALGVGWLLLLAVGITALGRTRRA